MPEENIIPIIDCDVLQKPNTGKVLVLNLLAHLSKACSARTEANYVARPFEIIPDDQLRRWPWP